MSHRDALADELPSITKSAAQEIVQKRLGERIKSITRKSNRLHIQFAEERKFALIESECIINGKRTCELAIGPDDNNTWWVLRLSIDTLNENSASLSYQLVVNQFWNNPAGVVVQDGLISLPYSINTDTKEVDNASVSGIPCTSKLFSVEGEVMKLGVHPESSIIDFVYSGEIGKPGGFKAFNYETGTQVDTLPSRSERFVDMVVSPTGKYVAFATGDCSVSPCTNTLKISALNGANPLACTSSTAYYRPLAFSSDESVLIGMSSEGSSDHRLVLCKTSGGLIGSWPNTTQTERLKQHLTPRLHGSSPWMVDFAAISPDQTKVLSGRIDGQIVLWDFTGKRLDETQISNYSPGGMETPFSFAEDQKVFRWRYYGNTNSDGQNKILVESLFPTQGRLELFHEYRARTGSWLEPVKFQMTAKGLYLLFLKPNLISVIHVSSGKVVAELPKDDVVNAVAVSHDGNLIAIAYPGEIVLWHLPKEGGRCAPISN